MGMTQEGPTVNQWQSLQPDHIGQHPMDTIWDCCENNLAGDSCSPLGQVWRVNMCLGTNLIKKSRMEQDVGTHILHVWAACPHSSLFYLSHASLQRMSVSCLLFPVGMEEERRKGSSHPPMLTEFDPCHSSLLHCPGGKRVFPQKPTLLTI